MTDEAFFNAPVRLVRWNDSSDGGMTVTFGIDDSLGGEGFESHPFKGVHYGKKTGQVFMLCVIPMTEEAVQEKAAATAKDVELPKCPVCQGTGKQPGQNWECRDCLGTGHGIRPQQAVLGPGAVEPLRPKRHRWDHENARRYENTTDRDCLQCGIIMRHRMEGPKHWHEYLDRHGTRIDSDGRTPPCAGQIAREA